MTPSSTMRDPAPGRYRLIDKVALGYFAIGTLLLAHPNRPDNWLTLLLFHAIYLVGIPAAVRWSNRSLLLSLFRDWYPVVGIMAMYGELQFLNRVLTDRYFDPVVMEWEEAIFGRQMAVHLREMIPSKLFGEAVHFGYFCYYLTIPSLLIPLWLLRKYREFRISVSVIGAVYIACYLWYLFWPVTGPYWQLPKPDPSTEGWLFPQITNFFVANGSSRGSAFPSSHVAASITVLGMARLYLKPVYRILFLPVMLLITGTVYGGFHYAIDAIAGLALGLTFDIWGPKVVTKVDGKAI
ncbi:MAG TPA: phosphatase PAP2 family protein [Candidatus Eisenbacteria bacterium]